MEKVQSQGFFFHSLPDGSADPKYWDESHAYELSSQEVDTLEDATNRLYRMCLSAVEYVIKNNLLGKLEIPVEFHSTIAQSWANQDPDLYGRFDLAFDSQGVPKMLEFNADTPTSLIEASIAQWFWLEDMNAKSNTTWDQFNSIHEKLETTIRDIGGVVTQGNLAKKWYFTCDDSSVEDQGTVDYLRDVAVQCGFSTQFINISDIGWNGRDFTDLDENIISAIFKLYPWEWLIKEDFGKNLITSNMKLVEPSWKLILSNKGILPILWEMYPNHPNLLPSFWEWNPAKFGNTYVSKPLSSREGADVSIVRDGVVTSTGKLFGDSSTHIYQQYMDLGKYDGQTPVIGSWVVGGRSCGVGFREDSSEITGNASHFVPHFFKDE